MAKKNSKSKLSNVQQDWNKRLSDHIKINPAAVPIKIFIKESLMSKK